MRIPFKITLAVAAAVMLPRVEVQAQWTSGVDECLPATTGCYLSPAQRVNSTAAFESWFSQLGTTGTESFQGYDLGEASPFVLSGYPGGVTAVIDYEGIESGSGSIADGGETNPNDGSQTLAGAGLYGVTPNGALNDDRTTDRFFFTNGGFNLTFTAGAPVYAFGFWGVDIGDWDKDFTARVFDNFNNQLGTELVYDGGFASGSVLFAGYFGSEQISRVRFVFEDNAVDGFGFDEMTIGIDTPGGPSETVPEPATMTLLATGLAGMAAARRRRKQG